MTMRTADWINIIGVILNCCVGIYIAITIQNKFAKTRSLRDYFIKELTSLQTDYSNFVDKIWQGELDAKTIKENLKSFSCRIQIIERYACKKFDLKAKEQLKEKHVDFQQELTMMDNFNEHYKDNKLKLDNASISVLKPKLNVFISSITEMVIDVNEAKFISRKK